MSDHRAHEFGKQHWQSEREPLVTQAMFPRSKLLERTSAARITHPKTFDYGTHGRVVGCSGIHSLSYLRFLKDLMDKKHSERVLYRVADRVNQCWDEMESNGTTNLQESGATPALEAFALGSSEAAATLLVSSASATPAPMVPSSSGDRAEVAREQADDPNEASTSAKKKAGPPPKGHGNEANTENTIQSWSSAQGSRLAKKMLLELPKTSVKDDDAIEDKGPKILEYDAPVRRTQTKPSQGSPRDGGGRNSFSSAPSRNRSRAAISGQDRDRGRSGTGPRSQSTRKRSRSDSKDAVFATGSERMPEASSDASSLKKRKVIGYNDIQYA